MIKDKIFLDTLPHTPGVYQMLDETRKILYVGKARDLKKRVSSYFAAKTHDLKTLNLIRQAKNIEITITRTEHEALLLECFLIKKHKPRYNILLRDDKSYPYILITHDQPYPRITFYRGVKKSKGQYFGPYPNPTAVRETIHIIQKLFHLRSCNNSFFEHRKRPCLHYQIGLCSGSCTGLISPEEYQKNIEHAVLFLKGRSQLIIQELQCKMEQASRDLNFEFAAKLRDQIAYLKEIQERQYVSTEGGNVDILGVAVHTGLACVYLLSIRDGRLLGNRSYFPILPSHTEASEILSAFISQHYLGHQQQVDLPQEIVVGELIEEHLLLEHALSERKQARVKMIKPMRGERRQWLEMAISNAKQALSGYLLQKINIQERVLALQKALNLNKPLERIECFDISHTQGEETVASCVAFNCEGPMKSDYRRFNINGITPGDDVAAMRQVLLRRFKRFQNEAGILPDLILIDGGRTQLAFAEKALAELHIQGILLVGVAKGEQRKPGLETLYFSHRLPMHLSPDSPALHFVQQIRDEAHRFAITGHRQKRDKKRRSSILETVPGIGAKRRRALLRHFGGLQAIEVASIDQLLAVSGITKTLAEKIYETFHSG